MLFFRADESTTVCIVWEVKAVTGMPLMKGEEGRHSYNWQEVGEKGKRRQRGQEKGGEINIFCCWGKPKLKRRDLKWGKQEREKGKEIRDRWIGWVKVQGGKANKG